MKNKPTKWGIKVLSDTTVLMDMSTGNKYTSVVIVMLFQFSHCYCCVAKLISVLVINCDKI